MSAGVADDKPQAAPAQHRRGGLFSSSNSGQRFWKYIPKGFAQHVPLHWLERRERGLVHEEDERPRPEVDVRRQVLRGRVVRVALDRLHLLLDPVEAADLRAGRNGDRGRAQRTQSLACDARLGDSDPLAAKVSGLRKRPLYAEELAQRARQDSESDEAEWLEGLEHLAGDTTLENLGLQRVTVDEERRVQRVEARDADIVPGSTPDRAEVGLPCRDVVDDRRLGTAPRPTQPAVSELEPHLPARQAGDLVGERLQLLRPVEAIRHRQGERGRLGLAAGTVVARARRSQRPQR